MGICVTDPDLGPDLGPEAAPEAAPVVGPVAGSDSLLRPWLDPEHP